MPVLRPHMHTDARTALGPHSSAGPEVTVARAGQEEHEGRPEHRLDSY